LEYLSKAGWLPLGPAEWPTTLWLDPNKPTDPMGTYEDVPILAWHLDKSKDGGSMKPVMVKDSDNRPAPVVQKKWHPPSQGLSIADAIQAQLSYDKVARDRVAAEARAQKKHDAEAA
jgi:hypothetical protein